MVSNWQNKQSHLWLVHIIIYVWMKFADIGSPGANLAMGRGEYQRLSVVKGSRNGVYHQKNGVVFLCTIRNTTPFRKYHDKYHGKYHVAGSARK